MSKKLIAGMLITLVLVVAATPVQAAGQGNQHNYQSSSVEGKQAYRYQEKPTYQHQIRAQQAGQPSELPGRQFFTLVGVITGLGGDSITVQIHNGNRFIKPYVGGEVAVQTTDGTEYRRWTPAGCVPIDPSEVEVGDTTSIQGAVSGESFVAERVTVDVPLDCCTP